MNRTVLMFDIFKDEHGRTIVQIGWTSFKRLVGTILLVGLIGGALLISGITGLIGLII